MTKESINKKHKIGKHSFEANSTMTAALKNLDPFEDRVKAIDVGTVTTQLSPELFRCIRKSISNIDIEDFGKSALNAYQNDFGVTSIMSSTGCQKTCT